MVRPRCITPDDVFQPLGEIARCILFVPLLFAMGAAVIAMLAVIVADEVIEWSHRNRFLGPITLGVLLALVALHFSGCANPPKADPRDPAIWRPTAPINYPVPK